MAVRYRRSRPRTSGTFCLAVRLARVGYDLDRSADKGLQASDVSQPVLLEDRGQVRLGHIVEKRAVAEDNHAFASRRKIPTPLNNPERQGLDVLASDRFRKADQQRSRADAMDRLPRDRLR